MSSRAGRSWASWRLKIAARGLKLGQNAVTEWQADMAGIPIDKIPVKGVVGLILTLGVMAIFLVAVPATRWLLLFSVPTGIVIALFLHFWYGRKG